jgi:hypothetical protein
MLMRRKSPTKSTARTIGLLTGQWSSAWRSVFLDQKASNLEPASLVKLRKLAVFTGRKHRFGKLVLCIYSSFYDVNGASM